MKGYINLVIGGKNRGIKFGNRALLDLITKHQAQQGFKFSFELIADAVYFGLLNNCLNKKEDPDFTLEQVHEWVDSDLPMPKLMEIFNVMQDSFTEEGDAKTTGTTTKKK